MITLMSAIAIMLLLWILSLIDGQLRWRKKFGVADALQTQNYRQSQKWMRRALHLSRQIEPYKRWLNDCRKAASFEGRNRDLAVHIKTWYEFALEQEKTATYYEGLLHQIGEIIGDDAHVCDDGTISEDVLIAKLPECVEKLKKTMVMEIKGPVTMAMGPTRQDSKLIPLPEWQPNLKAISNCLYVMLEGDWVLEQTDVGIRAVGPYITLTLHTEQIQGKSDPEITIRLLELFVDAVFAKREVTNG